MVDMDNPKDIVKSDITKFKLWIRFKPTKILDPIYRELTERIARTCTILGELLSEESVKERVKKEWSNMRESREAMLQDYSLKKELIKLELIRKKDRKNLHSLYLKRVLDFIQKSAEERQRSITKLELIGVEGAESKGMQEVVLGVAPGYIETLPSQREFVPAARPVKVHSLVYKALEGKRFVVELKITNGISPFLMKIYSIKKGIIGLNLNDVVKLNEQVLFSPQFKEGVYDLIILARSISKNRKEEQGGMMQGTRADAVLRMRFEVEKQPEIPPEEKVDIQIIMPPTGTRFIVGNHVRNIAARAIGANSSLIADINREVYYTFEWFITQEGYSYLIHHGKTIRISQEVIPNSLKPYLPAKLKVIITKINVDPYEIIAEKEINILPESSIRELPPHIGAPPLPPALEQLKQAQMQAANAVEQQLDIIISALGGAVGSVSEAPPQPPQGPRGQGLGRDTFLGGTRLASGGAVGGTRLESATEVSVQQTSGEPEMDIEAEMLRLIEQGSGEMPKMDEAMLNLLQQERGQEEKSDEYWKRRKETSFSKGVGDGQVGNQMSLPDVSDVPEELSGLKKEITDSYKTGYDSAINSLGKHVLDAVTINFKGQPTKLREWLNNREEKSIQSLVKIGKQAVSAAQFQRVIKLLYRGRNENEKEIFNRSSEALRGIADYYKRERIDIPIINFVRILFAAIRNL